MQDDFSYHSSSNIVYVGRWALEIDALWNSIDEIERGGITLTEIHHALNVNWSAAVVALARKNIAVLRALIAEAQL
jgi:hypothetical protein